MCWYIGAAPVLGNRDYSVPTIDEGQYTFPSDIEHSFLTAEQKRQYEVDGYFVVKGVVPLPDLEKYINPFTIHPSIHCY
jgi:hypothetical protein